MNGSKTLGLFMHICVHVYKIMDGVFVEPQTQSHTQPLDPYVDMKSPRNSSNTSKQEGKSASVVWSHGDTVYP